MNFKPVCILCLLLVICTSPVSASDTTISVSDITSGLGFTVDTDIIINTAASYGTGTINLDYDPDIVHAVDVRGSQESTITASNIDNINGRVTISAWNLNGISGEFPYAIVTFMAISTGTSPMDISGSLLDTSYNDLVPTIDDGSITIHTSVSTSDFSTEGQSVNAGIRINTTEHYGTGTISVAYDPSIIKAIDVSGGDVVAWNADNINGSVQICTLNLTGTGGDFDLATIVFEPVANGKSGLGIEIILLQDISYNDIPAVCRDGSITVDVESSTSSGSTVTGGGGSGGGGGTTGEEYKIIEHKMVVRKYLNKDQEVSYEFDSEKSNIDYIKFIPLKNSGEIAVTLEVLRDTSALVKNPPPAKVYRNMNIWIGKAGFATSENIAYAVIGCKVEKSWIEENDIDISSIRICRYNNDVWGQLTTLKVNEDDKYIYFEAETLGFSPFAIIGESVPESSPSGEIRLYSTDSADGIKATSEEVPVTTPESSSAENTPKTPGFGLFAGISVLLITLQVLRKKN